MVDKELTELTYLKDEIDDKFNIAYTEINQNTDAIQTVADAMEYTIMNGVDVDTITNVGIYEVNTNLPDGLTLAQLEVKVYNNNVVVPNRVVQILTDDFYGLVWERAANDFENPVWSSWFKIRIPLGSLGDVEATVKDDNAPLKYFAQGDYFTTKKGTTDVSYLNVDENIRFLSATNPSYEGMKVVMGQDGVLALKKDTVVDHFQVDEYTQTTQLTTTSTEMFSVTADIEYLIADSTSGLSLMVSNTDSGNFPNDDTLNVVFKVNGSVTLTKQFTIPGGTENQSLFIFDDFYVDRAIGDIFTAELYCDNGLVRLDGATQKAVFKVNKTGDTSTAVTNHLNSLDSKAPFVPVYQYDSRGISDTGNPILIESTNYEIIANLDRSVINFPAGTYQVTFSATYLYSNTSRSAMFSWSLNGGTNWEDFSMEAKDTTDLRPLTYTFPFEHLGGGIDFVFSAKCENSSDTLTVNYSNIIFERKL